MAEINLEAVFCQKIDLSLVFFYVIRTWIADIYLIPRWPPSAILFLMYG